MTNKRDTIIYWTGFGVIMALLIVAPLVLPPFWSRFVTEILIWGLLAMSSDILIGYTGMVSFGHSAFFGLGMYGAAAALLMVSPPNLLLALAFGLIAAAAVSAFVAYFSTRLRDIYFAITTLIFSQIFYVIIFTWTEVTGGENGLSFRRPGARHSRASGPRRSPPRRCTGSCWRWWPASYLILRRIMRSPFGMVLQSIRENEPRTRAIGYPVERYKIVAVMLSGLFAGLAGVLYAVQNRFAAPDFVFFLDLRRGGDLQRHGRHRHAGRADRRRRHLPAAARRPRPPVRRPVPLSDPARLHLHRHHHLPAAGPARLHAALAEQIAAVRGAGAKAAGSTNIAVNNQSSPGVKPWPNSESDSRCAGSRTSAS